MTKVVSEDAPKDKKNQENLSADNKKDAFCHCTSENGDPVPGPSSTEKPRTQSSSSAQNKVPKWFKQNKK